MTRRDWLRAAIGVFASLGGAMRPAAAQTRMSQAEAAYQGTPKDLLMCGTCTFFLRPNACKVVEGTVDRLGWCKLYDMTD